MLGELKRHHRAVETLIGDLETLLAGAAPDRLCLSQARLRLTQASGRRTRYLTETIFPALLARLDPPTAAPVRRLHDETVAMRALSTGHIGHWTIDRIVADWPAYQCASAKVRAAMRIRLATERTTLYPLLG